MIAIEMVLEENNELSQCVLHCNGHQNLAEIIFNFIAIFIVFQCFNDI